MTEMDGGEFVCYKCFSWEPFYCVQMNPLCKLYIEPYGKNYMYQADTGALNKNIRFNTEENVNEMFHKLAYQQMQYPQNGII